MKDALFWPGAGGGGGSAGAVKKSTIVVTYPVGAECFVSNGTQAYRALDKSGTAAFIVEPGTWNVSATLGSDYASENITVEAGGWVEVELSFKIYLFDGAKGGDVTEITGGWSVNNKNLAIISSESLSATLSNDGNYEYRGEFTTVNAIEFAGKTELYVTVAEGSGDYGFVSILSGGSEVATQKRLAVGTFSLEIPAGLQEGNVRVGVGQRLLGVNSQKSIFTEIWMR